MLPDPKSPCLLDTSVLVNFLVVDRIDLLGEQPMRRFLVTPHVDHEILDHYIEQRERLHAAMTNGWLEGTRLEAIEELARFAKLLVSGLGPGEAAAVAAAVNRKCSIAIEDSVGQRRAREFDKRIEVVTTKDIMLDAIMSALITIDDADEIKGQWESLYRFRIPGLSSFSEIVNW